ncbi:MAG: universal stress protein, partial [Desulfosarcina sp.]
MSPTIQAIVCAIDFSSFSPLVIRHGVALARRAGARLYLIHAVHDPQDGAHPTALFERGGDLDQIIADARSCMHALMAHHTLRNWEAVIRYGEPVEQTVDFVDELPASLVVSASHGVSGFRRLFVGTVVERMTRRLNRPMLVVKPVEGGGTDPSAGFGSLLVSCDEKGHWRQLAPLQPLLQPDVNARIDLVHALENPGEGRSTDSDGASYAEVQETLQDRIRCRLRQQARRLFPHVDRLDFHVAPGVPHEMVLNIARR